MSKVQIKPCKSLKWVDCNEDCNNCPIVEVGKVKHGRWISTASTLTGYWHKCSGCGGVAIPYYNGQDILSPYCPWCGARMDEVEK